MIEVNFDGLVGPTHHFAGLAYGNLASMKHASMVSNPKKAALQGLAKMKRLHDLGLVQAVLPPQKRPALSILRSLGFAGKDYEILARTPPALLCAAYSSSAMWRANSATVTPSCDSHDGKVHLTIANLQNTPHRCFEVEETIALFHTLFADPNLFTIHPPLPFPDEGAANHIRLGNEKSGRHLYVYGKELFRPTPSHFPARQTREASEAIARLHGGKAVFAKQNPAFIEKGVFHNDVISFGNQETLLYHKEAFENTEQVLRELAPLRRIEIPISVEKAVETYLFNSQLLTLPDGSQLLLAPEPCRELELSWLPFPIEYVDLSESMQNGGGPACLRLAIPLTEEQIQHIPPSIFLTDPLYQTLVKWVETHYRDRLHLDDLADPKLLDESLASMEALSKILPVIG